MKINSFKTNCILNRNRKIGKNKIQKFAIRFSKIIQPYRDPWSLTGISNKYWNVGTVTTLTSIIQHWINFTNQQNQILTFNTHLLIFFSLMKGKLHVTKAAPNDYCDNWLVGRLFFRLIGFKKTLFFILLAKNTTPHSVQCLSNKRANWMIHILHLLDHYHKEKTQIF